MTDSDSYNCIGINKEIARGLSSQITPGHKVYHVGYYGIAPWDATGRYIACLEADLQDRLPQDGDAAVKC